MQAHSLNGVWLLAETAAPRLLWPSPGSPTARERKHIAVVIWEHNKGPCVSAVQSTQHTWLVTSPRGGWFVLWKGVHVVPGTRPLLVNRLCQTSDPAAMGASFQVMFCSVQSANSGHPLWPLTLNCFILGFPDRLQSDGYAPCFTEAVTRSVAKIALHILCHSQASDVVSTLEWLPQKLI